MRKILHFETEKLRLKLNDAFAQRDKERFFYLSDVFDSLTIERFSYNSKIPLTKEQKDGEPTGCNFTANSCEGLGGCI